MVSNYKDMDSMNYISEPFIPTAQNVYEGKGKRKTAKQDLAIEECSEKLTLPIK